MSRKKKGFKPEDDEPNVDISSMIDVCFLLLIYFIVTSTIAEKEADLILALPSDAAGEPSDIDPLFFSVAANGQIQKVQADTSISNIDTPGKSDFSHRSPEELPQLASDVAEYKAYAGESCVVKIKVSSLAKTQYVVDLINVLKDNDITQITFTASSEE